METLKKVRDYLLEEEFKITAGINYVNVVNYEEIIHFDNHEVIIRYVHGKITITGEKLVVNKLVNEEVLVCGKIKKIELG